MMVSKVRTFMLNEGVIFSFSGLISQEFTASVIKTVDEELSSLIEDNNMTKTMISLTIEQLQNVMSYSKNKHIKSSSKFMSPGVLVIGFDKNNNKFYVTSSNEILECDKDKIVTKIDFINSMEKEDLRKYIRIQLRNGENKHERGAGIGFEEMAKRSSEKIVYDFEEIDGKSYFHILTYI